MIAEHVLRNIAIKQCFICMENLGPDSHKRQPGLLADLQEARATKTLLIKRENNHVS